MRGEKGGVAEYTVAAILARECPWNGRVDALVVLPAFEDIIGQYHRLRSWWPRWLRCVGRVGISALWPMRCCWPREQGASLPELATAWSTSGRRDLVRGPDARLTTLHDRVGIAEDALQRLLPLPAAGSDTVSVTGVCPVRTRRYDHTGFVWGAMMRSDTVA